MTHKIPSTTLKTKDSHLDLSNSCVARGEIAAAIQHLHQALRLNPQFPEAYNNLGRLLYKQAQFKEAAFYLAKALRIKPQYWEAHYNMAHCLVKQNQLIDAATHYLEVIKIIPTHTNAHFNLGFIYLDEENYPLAEKHFNEVIAIEPDNLEALRQLGFISIQLGKPDTAVTILQKAISLCPSLSDAHHNLAILYLRQENRTDALRHFQTALELDPNNTTASHMVSALTGNSSLTAPPEYIRQLFDQYAADYDTQMKTALNYQAPFALRSAIGCLLGEKLKPGRVLDLGCGTGLVGVYCRDLALELVGVDISEKMLEKAKELMAYESLVNSDITAYLEKKDILPFDLIIASDVLVYYGSLDFLFSLISTQLSFDGLFAFTTEILTVDQDYQLQSTGRFAHSEAYLLTLAAKYALSVRYHDTLTIREQNGHAIQGQLFILQNVGKKLC